MNTFAKALVLALFLPMLTHAQGSSPFSEALVNGRYLEIHDKPDAKRDGEWAWSRFFLKHDSEALKAAKRAHKNGDILGTFILLKCYRNGVGVKKDDVIKEQLNQLLKQKLTAKKSHNNVEKYMLAYLLPPAERAQTQTSYNKIARTKTTELILGKSRWQHLTESASAGLAQALVEAGATLQKKNIAGAKTIYEKAAELGLAEGMQRLGLVYAIAPQFQDLEKAKEWSKKAAERGDAQAMINLASLTKEKTWIEKAGASGHPVGLVEHGVAYYLGSFGLEVDKNKGKQILQQAAKAGDSTTLSKLSHVFHMGLGVTVNLEKAAKFSEAAYIQGDVGAPMRLRVLYQTLYEEDPARFHDQSKYWLEVSRGSKPTAPHITGPLNKIDPFNMSID